MERLKDSDRRGKGRKTQKDPEYSGVLHRETGDGSKGAETREMQSLTEKEIEESSSELQREQIKRGRKRWRHGEEWGLKRDRERWKESAGERV